MKVSPKFFWRSAMMPDQSGIVLEQRMQQRLAMQMQQLAEDNRALGNDLRETLLEKMAQIAQLEEKLRRV